MAKQKMLCEYRNILDVHVQYSTVQYSTCTRRTNAIKTDMS